MHLKNTIRLRLPILLTTPQLEGPIYVFNTCTFDDNHNLSKEVFIFNPIFVDPSIVNLLMQHEPRCGNLIRGSSRGQRK